MKKRDVIQNLEELWGKAPLPADFREVISTPMAVGQEEDYEELEELEDDKEKEEIREIIQGLEELWGKAPLPTDFREVVSTPDWQQSSRRSQSGRVVSMADHRRKRELLLSGISLGGVVAACLVLILSWSLRGGELAQITADVEALFEQTNGIEAQAKSTGKRLIAGMAELSEQNTEIEAQIYKTISLVDAQIKASAASENYISHGVSEEKQEARRLPTKLRLKTGKDESIIIKCGNLSDNKVYSIFYPSAEGKRESFTPIPSIYDIKNRFWHM